jgi:hypothetical protein
LNLSGNVGTVHKHLAIFHLSWPMYPQYPHDQLAVSPILYISHSGFQFLSPSFQTLLGKPIKNDTHKRTVLYEFSTKLHSYKHRYTLPLTELLHYLLVPAFF